MTERTRKIFATKTPTPHASELQMSEPYGHWIEQETGENDVNLSLPVNKPNVEIPVIEVFLKE